MCYFNGFGIFTGDAGEKYICCLPCFQHYKKVRAEILKVLTPHELQH